MVACGIAYYFKRKHRVVIHEAMTRSQMVLELDPSTEQATEANME